MRRKIDAILWLLLFTFWIGCAPRVLYLPLQPSSPSAKGLPNPLPVYSEKNPPPKPYRVIGTMFVDEPVDLFNVLLLKDSRIIRKLRKVARKHGAEAIYIGELKPNLVIIPSDQAPYYAKLKITKNAVAYAIVFEESPADSSKGVK